MAEGATNRRAWRLPGAGTVGQRVRGFAERRWVRRVAFLAVVLVFCALVAPRVATWSLARGEVADRPSELERVADGSHRAAIVLGAGLFDGRPSPLLDDRIQAAVELLAQDRVDLLVMSGDNSTDDYDEPTAMRTRALELGAPVDQVAADYAGRRTWDTCVRAREVFGIRDAVVVTSAFHVDRALVSCRAADIDAVGYSVAEDDFGAASRARWRLRELAATGRALVDAWALRPRPAVGGAPIDPYDRCELAESLATSDAEGDRICRGGGDR